MSDENSMHIITNFEELATTPARTSILSIAEAGYRSIETDKVIRTNVILEDDMLTVGSKTYNLAEYGNIYILGIGKCAHDSAVELEAILGDRITEGVVVDVSTSDVLKKVRCLVGTHPFPSEENISHTRELLELAERATEHDLVIMVVSGGGSTLLCQPETHSYADETKLVEYLFRAGATIDELNTIRRHLSKARGGFVAQSVNPATLISLIFSDVPGDDIRVISSSPTVFDPTTLDDAFAVFDKYQADNSGFSREHFFETPKDESIFMRVQNELILKNTTALEAMKNQAEQLGYAAIIRETKLQGEARVVGEELAYELHSAKARTVYLYGGETTVTITGPGKGGRNQELSLAALPLLEEDELVLSLASDGHDNTDFAGGIADKYTRGKAEDKGLKSADFLFVNDSFSFFKSLEQGIRTGYTGANVADLVIAIKHER